MNFINRGGRGLESCGFTQASGFPTEHASNFDALLIHAFGGPVSFKIKGVGFIFETSERILLIMPSGGMICFIVTQFVCGH